MKIVSISFAALARLWPAAALVLLLAAAGYGATDLAGDFASFHVNGIRGLEGIL